MSEAVCARCPKRLGASCCEVGEGGRLATLTVTDVERIAQAVRRRPESFAAVEWLEDSVAAQYARVWPLYDGYFRHGPARWTLQTQGGSCVFHDRATGCRLSEEARPTACRLYPFEPRQDGSVGLQVTRGSPDGATDACLAVEEAKTLDDVLRVFALTSEKVSTLCERLRREVLDHAQATGPKGRCAGGLR